MRNILITFLFISINLCSLSQSYSKQFVPYRVGNKWTVSDLDGTKLTLQTFDSVVHFKGTKYILIQNSSKWGLLDTTMKIIIPCEYDFPPWYCKYGILVVKNDKMGLLNELGELIIPIKYKLINPGINYQNRIYTFITDLKIIKNPGNAQTVGISNNNVHDPSWILKQKLLSGIQRYNMNRFPFFDYSKVDFYYQDSCFTTLIEKDGEFFAGLYNAKGYKLLEEKYTTIKPVGKLILTYDGEYITIWKRSHAFIAIDSFQTNGSCFENNEYDKYDFRNYYFTEDFLLVNSGRYFLSYDLSSGIKTNRPNYSRYPILLLPKTHSKRNSNFYEIVDDAGHYITNKHGHRITQYHQESADNNNFHQNGKYLIYKNSVIDTAGTIYFQHWNHKNIKYVKLHSELFEREFTKDSNRIEAIHGYLNDTAFNWVLRLNKFPYKTFRGDYLFVRSSNKKWGVFNLKGDQILDFRYDQIEYASFDSDTVYFSVRVGKNWGLMDENGHQIFPIRFKGEHFYKWEININNTTKKIYYSVELKQGAQTLVNENGKDILKLNNQYYQYLGGNVLAVYDYDSKKNVVKLFNMESGKYFYETVRISTFPIDKIGNYWQFGSDDEFEFEDGFMTVSDDKNWYIIDKNGVKINDKGFNEPGEYFPNNSVVAFQNYKLIYYKGKLSDLKFHEIRRYHRYNNKLDMIVSSKDSLGKIKFFKMDESLKYFPIDIEELSYTDGPYYIFKRNNYFGIKDSTMQDVLPAKYKTIEEAGKYFVLSTDTCHYLYDPFKNNFNSLSFYSFYEPGYGNFTFETVRMFQSCLMMNTINCIDDVFLKGQTRFNPSKHIKSQPVYNLYDFKGNLLAEQLETGIEIEDSLFLAMKDGYLFYLNINTGKIYKD